jgi:hypothetical protein
MKKIIAVFLLLFCGLVVLLATVDLEPYLAPAPSLTEEEIAPPPVPRTDTVQDTAMMTGQAEETVIPGSEPNIDQDRAATGATHTPGEETPPLNPEEEIAANRQQTPSPAATPEAVPADESETGQPPAAQIELEVTILPRAEYPFSILLDTFIKRETAQQAIFFYKRRGLATHWVRVDLGEKGVRYRVFTGVFTTETEAEQYLARNQLLDKPIKPTTYAARIGVYQDKSLLASAFVKARATGFVPYILGTQNGDYFLYIGAFYTYIGAIDQCRELTAAGLSCDPVKRSTIPPQ